MEKAIFQNPWAAYAELKAMDVSQTSRETQVLYYLRVAHSLQFLYLHKEFESAINRGIKLISSNTPVRQQVFLYALSGVELQREGNYFEAIRSQATAVELAKNHNLRFAAIFSLVELAYSEALQGNHSDAIAHLEEAEAIAAQLDDIFTVAMINEVYGVVYSYMNDYESSIERYRQALDVYTNLGYLAYQAEAVNGLGITNRYARRWDEAVDAFRQYQVLTQNNGSPHGRFTAHYGLGMTFAEKGDCESALDAIDTALSVEGPLDYKAELYKRQAVCLAKAGDETGAMQALYRARTIFADIPELHGTIWEVDTLKSEASVLASLGQSEEAFVRLLEYHDKALIIDRRAAAEKLKESEALLASSRNLATSQLAQAEAAIAQLEQERATQTQLVKQYLLLIVALLVATTLGIVIYLRRQNKILKALTTTDELTRVFNRRHAFELLQQATSNLPLAVGKLSVMLVDIDDFKSINDQYGHPAGDQVLKEVAGLMTLVTRAEDSVARIGGEEFLIILPRLDEAEALRVAERLLSEVRTHRFALGLSQSITITLSAGLASFGKDCPGTEALYQSADEALYHSKSAGKDRATPYSAITPDPPGTR